MTSAERLSRLYARRDPNPDRRRKSLAEALSGGGDRPTPYDTSDTCHPGSTPEVPRKCRMVTFIELIAYGRSPEEGLAASRKADEEAFGAADPTDEGAPTEGQEAGTKFATTKSLGTTLAQALSSVGKKPFFPGGKVPGSMPPGADKLNAAFHRMGPDNEITLSPYDLLNAFYKSTGGVDAAMSAATKYRNTANATASAQPPVKTWFNPKEIGRQIPIMGAAADPSNSAATYGTPGTPGSEHVRIATNTDGHFVGPGEIPGAAAFHTPFLNEVNHFPTGFTGGNDVGASVEHELNHIVQEQGVNPRLAPHTPTSTEEIMAHGYFHNPFERSQGEAKLKQETAALTGRRIDSPQDVQQLIKEINPTDPDGTAFEKRIAPYSTEGQRYFRFLRHNAWDPEYLKNMEDEAARQMPGMIQNGPTDQFAKAADSWLERWLALQATRDAANQAVPEKDALTSKFLGGPLSLGLAEAASNHLTLGDTVGERRKNLTSASQAVRYGSYPDALRRGLSALPNYAGAGAVGGFGLSLGSDAYHNRPLDGPGAVRGALVGAVGGSALSLARPVLQKLILDNVSNRARRKAIRIKADSPLITSVPFGDMTAAALHKEAGWMGTLAEGAEKLAPKLFSGGAEAVASSAPELSGMFGAEGLGAAAKQAPNAFASAAKAVPGALSNAARYAARVPEGENYFSSIPKGISRIAQTAFKPNLPGPLKHLPTVLTGYGLFDAGRAAGHYYDTANDKLKGMANNLANTSGDIENATRLAFGQPGGKQITQSVGSALSSMDPRAGEMIQAAQGGIEPLREYVNAHWNEMPAEMQAKANQLLSTVKGQVSNNVRYHLGNTPWWHQAMMAIGSPGQLLLRKALAPSSYDDRDLTDDVADTFLPRAMQGADAATRRDVNDVRSVRDAFNQTTNPISSGVAQLQETARARALPYTVPAVSSSLSSTLP